MVMSINLEAGRAPYQTILLPVQCLGAGRWCWELVMLETHTRSHTCAGVRPASSWWRTTAWSPYHWVRTRFRAGGSAHCWVGISRGDKHTGPVVPVHALDPRKLQAQDVVAEAVFSKRGGRGHLASRSAEYISMLAFRHDGQGDVQVFGTAVIQ